MNLGTLRCTIAYNEFGAYCVPDAAMHRPVAQRILASKVHEPFTLTFMREYADGKDIVHAGTFFGDFLPGLASALGSGCRLWAFEPNTENYRCAAITCLLNSLDNVVLTHAALGSNNGQVLLQISDEHGTSLGGGSRIPNDRIHAVRQEEVKQVTLDTYLPSDCAIGILQLDTEGHEQFALAGAMTLICRNRPIIILETVPDISWLDEHIFPLGYKIRGSLHDNTILSTTEVRVPS